jgi:hypothetical protein
MSDSTASNHVSLLRDMRNGKDCNLEAIAAIQSLEARIALLEAKVQRVYNAGIKGIGHVGTANYPEREREARRWVQEALQEQANE